MYLRSCAGESDVVLELELDVLVLQPAQPLVGVGDVVEGLEHLGLELGLDRRERERVLHVVVVEIAFAGAPSGFSSPSPSSSVALGRLERGGGRGRRRRRGVCASGRRDHRGARHRHDRLAVGADHRGRHGLGVGARIGRFEVDDVAQEDLALVELVAPDDDGLEGERALAQPRDHGLAAGLDALGDGDLALARKQFHRAHLAEIHAHRVVGALGGLLGLGFGRDLLLDLDQLPALAFRLFVRLLALFLFLLGLLGLDHVDAHLAEHREDILDLLGIDLLRGRWLEGPSKPRQASDQARGRAADRSHGQGEP